MPLRDICVPTPQYHMNRYNSKVLLTWLERCLLIRVEAKESVKAFEESDPMYHFFTCRWKEATNVVSEIVPVLQRRGYTDDYFALVESLIVEDVKA